MGYRSEVYIAMDSHAIASMHALISLSSDNYLLELLNESCMHSCQGDEHEFTVYEWIDVKWYEGYHGIGAMTAFLASLPDMAYGYVRLGEDYADVETVGDVCRFNLYVERRVSWA